MDKPLRRFSPGFGFNDIIEILGTESITGYRGYEPMAEPFLGIVEKWQADDAWCVATCLATRQRTVIWAEDARVYWAAWDF